MISIVITTMKSPDICLKSCLQSIIDHTNLVGDDKEVIVVANDCTKETLEYVGALGHPFKMIWSHKPLGFSGANNAGIKQAKGDVIVLLNDDIVLLPGQPKDHWLHLLIEPFLADSSVGMTGAVKFTFDCRGIDREAIAFWCVMIKREVITRVGLLDEIFHPYGCEDIDYSIRASNLGYRLVQVPVDNPHRFLVELPRGGFPIYHMGSKTTDALAGSVENKSAQERRNMNIIYKRYGK